MHTIKVIAGGLALLALCLFIGRAFGGPGPAAGIAQGAKIFVPIWFVVAGVNLWLGVSKAGYTLADEAPIFLLVFAVPAAAALLFWWLAARA